MSRRFRLLKPAFKAHYDIISDDDAEQRQFYVDIKVKPFSKSVPGLTLYAGSDNSDNAPILGASYKPAFSETIKVAFGDPGQTSHVEWEELEKTKLSRFEYKWSTYMPSKDTSDDEDRLTDLLWKRTSSEGVDGVQPSSWSPRNWKLTGDDGVVLAVFTSDKGIGKAGTLEIRADKGADWDIKVLMTLVCIYHRASQGGG
ncbi:hypothetical protein VHEMI05368 [[Torrubiella] hemipterigena]|uniref:Uncharacterized protein n=1 Tax=[Torrubiella] hemipterigena TaxID=1531966 RepID=A0A0A1TIJ2_9HYPO|nr:hypothetical protein VHEMI05368 [[Torrubiella] hemipterigena]